MRAVACVVMLGISSVAAAKPSLNEKVDAFGKEFDTGDSFQAAVLRAQDMFGDPQVVTGKEIDWFVEDAEMCFKFDLTDRGDGYLVAWHADGQATATEKYAACHAKIGAKAKLPPLAPVAPLDADKLVPAVMKAFAENKFAVIFDSSSEDLKREVGSAAGFAHYWSYFSPTFGAYVKTGPVSARIPKQYGWELTAPAVFAKGTLEAKLRFVRTGTDGVLLRSISINVPTPLQHRPTPAEAAAFGEKSMRAFFTSFDTFYDLMLPGLQEKLGDKAALAKAVRDLAAKVGPIASIKVTKSEACDGQQCLTFAVTGRKAKTTATLSANFTVSRWEIYAFNVDQP